MIGFNYAFETVKKEFLKDISSLGGLGFFLLTIIFTYLIGETIFTIKLILSLGIIFIVVYSIKIFYVKPRPETEIKKSFSFLEKLNKSSFPSLHTARISLLSTSVYSMNNNLIYFSVLILLIVCYSRVYLKKHFFEDVIAGVILGLLVGYYIFIV